MGLRGVWPARKSKPGISGLISFGDKEQWTAYLLGQDRSRRHTSHRESWVHQSSYPHQRVSTSGEKQGAYINESF
jgi:hypothetical protein